MPPTDQTVRARKPDHARRVCDLLRSRLLNDDFPGERLPDEARLMAEYGVGRNVVRAALAQLQREGVILRTQGAGTFVARRKTCHRLVDVHGFSGSVLSPYTRLASRVLSVQQLPATPGVAAQLATAVGAPCVVVDLVTTLDGQPASVLTSYVADPDARDVLSAALRPGRWVGDWYDLLTQARLEPRRREMAIEAIAADELVAPVLEARVGHPLMRFQRTMELGEGAVREFGFSVCRGDLWTFTMSGQAAAPAPAAGPVALPAEAAR